MDTNACPKCGSTDCEAGTVVSLGVVFSHPIQFKQGSTTFGNFEDSVSAAVCKNCGHIELFMEKFRKPK